MSSQHINSSQKVTIVGSVVNFLLATAKIIIGVLGNSGALVADGIHSFSDLLSDGMVLYATKHSKQEADDEHPYGHERFETVATLGLSIILALTGAGIIADAFARLSSSTILTHSYLLLGVATLSILVKEALYWYTLRVAKICQSEMLTANAWHHRSDGLSSIVVLIGIIGSLNGYWYLDGSAAAVVGAMIIYIAWKLGINAIKELVDTSIDSKSVANLKHAIRQISGVNNIHSLRSRKVGRLISCDVHVQVDPFLSVSEGHMISVSVEHVVAKCLGNLNDVTVHIDPEDDELNTLYAQLPERSVALKILNKALLDNKCDGEIQRIVLHYLGGKIHVDFYLPLSCFSAAKSQSQLLAKLKSTVATLPNFGEVRLYFS